MSRRLMNAGGNKFNAFCQGGGDKKGGLAPHTPRPFSLNNHSETKELTNVKYFESKANQLSGNGQINRIARKSPSADGVNIATLKANANACVKTNKWRFA